MTGDSWRGSITHPDELGSGNRRRLLTERSVTMAITPSMTLPWTTMQPCTGDPHVTVEREENHAVVALSLLRRRWPHARQTGAWPLSCAPPSPFPRGPEHVYPHLRRHTVATRLLALGMDIIDLQRFVGHERRQPASRPRRRPPRCSVGSTSSPMSPRTHWSAAARRQGGHSRYARERIALSPLTRLAAFHDLSKTLPTVFRRRLTATTSCACIVRVPKF